MQNSFDIIVIGGGHAGIEAAWAASGMGARTAMVTMDKQAIGRMSCNPAIGGVAKGQLVRDLDALGGLMGWVSDRAGIQFRMLNMSKGPAVWGPRAQMDMDLYARIMQEVLSSRPNLALVEGELTDFTSHSSGGFALELLSGESLRCRSLILTSGTFLGAVMYTGLQATEGGRIGEPAAKRLSETLKAMGLKTRRLKTGTPARLDRRSLDFSRTEIQYGDKNPVPFSFRSTEPVQNFATCWITRTSEETHSVLREGFSQSPMFSGVIQGLGPRYCPSIEDKIHRFADKDSHQLFLEPEGLGNDRIYINGFSSSLPADIQLRALRTIPGLENCRVLRFGYAVEYDSVDATQLQPTYECLEVPGLYFAGQVNGTSGYEEAAVQGFMAGVNAVLKLEERKPFLLSRAESYIGVLTDDLIQMQMDEPYRMFTSRAEHRLHLRQDNAEDRLLQKGHELGLIDAATLERHQESQRRIEACRVALRDCKLRPELLNPKLEVLGSSPVRESVPALSLLRRPELSLKKVMALADMSDCLEEEECFRMETAERYAGFFERQTREIERAHRLADTLIPEAFDYEGSRALSIEARQKLAKRRPLTVGQAGRIPGVSPADISALLFHLRKGTAPAP